MIREIVLLTGEVEGSHLAGILRRDHLDLSVVTATDRQSLIRACVNQQSPGGRRLVSFCSPVIVPPEVLGAVTGPAYNFHPGPPEYPGAHAASFAIYDNAKGFGVTVHEMAKKVDAGPIVAVERFDVPESARYMDLELLAYKIMVGMFHHLARRLASDEAPLAVINETWGAKKTTEADFEHMRRYDQSTSEGEITRRFRAFG